MNYEEAIATIKRFRPTICINKGFEMQLKAYAHAQCDIYQAQQLLLHMRIRMLKKFRGDANGYLKAMGHKKDPNLFKPNNNNTTKSSGHKRTWDDVKLAVEEIAADSEEHDGGDDNIMNSNNFEDNDDLILTSSKKYNTLSDQQYMDLAMSLSDAKGSELDFENDAIKNSPPPQQHVSQPSIDQIHSPGKRTC
jgi:DUF1680 family protein